MRLKTTSVRHTVQGVGVNFHAFFNLNNRPGQVEASRFPSAINVCHNAMYVNVFHSAIYVNVCHSAYM